MRQCQTFFSWQTRSGCVQNRAWLVLVLCSMFGQLSFFQCMSVFTISELMFDEVVLFFIHTHTRSVAALQLFFNLGFGLLPLAPSLRSWNTACAGLAAWGWFGLWPYVFSCLGVGAALPLDACAINSSSRVLSWRAGARLVTGGDPRSRVPP